MAFPSVGEHDNGLALLTRPRPFVSILVFPAVITIPVLIGALLGGLELDVNMFSFCRTRF